MEEFIAGIKYLFLYYICFALYGIIGIWLITGILPALISAITFPFAWVKRKLFGD